MTIPSSTLASKSLPKVLLGAGIAALILVAFGWLAPKWLVSLSMLALSLGLVSLGVFVLMRCGVVPFGQGLVYAAGGYAAALAFNHWGIKDAVLLALLGGIGGVVITLPFAPFLARYRGIFFAMLTLALSMILYGVLMKSQSMGGSDGFNVTRATVFGYRAADDSASALLHTVIAVITVLLATLTRLYCDSARGLVSQAVRDNELRVEYLGVSVAKLMISNLLIAGALGGVGGALSILALGHIDPQFAYWTTSGEFVFVAILSGHYSVVALFASSFILELVRSFSSAYFPNAWQLSLGLFLLIVIRFLPNGLGSLWARLTGKSDGASR
jgi:ABC-type branched-subunit amino acid transport system permease subunit